MTRTAAGAAAAVARVLPDEPLTDLAEYRRAGGARGLEAARRLGAAGVVEHLLAAGLRGRGGAGFPTGRKWGEVAVRTSASIPTTVVVNAAEGEPGSFKDRAILGRNPFAVLEGALIAADVVASDHVVIAVKESFAEELAILRDAVAALEAANMARGVVLEVFAGPGAYLYGEETALLEAIDGRPPFPRVAPPYRYGVDEVTAEYDDAPPALVDNVETMANVPGILAWGPRWFRELGTDESPGTIVCTVSGDVEHAGVAEMPCGTALREIVETIGGGARPGHEIVAVMSGVANPVVPARLLDTPASYEGMQAIGSGLGATGFLVFDDSTDFVALAHGVARFLGVESCGQCTACKQDGVALADLFGRVLDGDARDGDITAIDDHLRTIADGARCYLATQHQRVVGSIVDLCRDQIRARVHERRPTSTRVLIAPLVSIDDGIATVDERQRDKQPDWSHDAVHSDKTPVERLGTGHPATGRASRPTPPPAPAARGTDSDGRRARSGAGMEATGTDRNEERPQAEHRVEDVEADPEAPLYSSVPLETDDGTIVVQQQNVGAGREEGGGEWPDPHTPPRGPAPGAD